VRATRRWREGCYARSAGDAIALVPALEDGRAAPQETK
jgi:hypothetical protein